MTIKGDIMPQINGALDQLFSSKIQTDFGWLRPISDGHSLIRLDWNQTGWDQPCHADDVSRETIAQLAAFFAGRLQQFTVPLDPVGKSTAGRYWLDIMAKIPYGTVMSYGEFANFAGKSGAARAAGSSCASNPIPIIYPCHRVVRADGSLGNYGGGSDNHPAHQDNLARKAALLALETASKSFAA